MQSHSLHDSVLLQESIAALAIRPDGIYLDATFGRGGHSEEILSKLGEHGRLLVCDRDPEAIIVAREMAALDDRLLVIDSPFSRIKAAVEELGLLGALDGILFDFGVSSPQLDNAQRGFSFMRDGPLDMRMDPAAGVSAAQWINSASEKDIADVIYTYGEERHSRRMAKWIVEERNKAPIVTTGRLAEIIKEANPAWEKDKHPATRAFQAIRIFINDEFAEIESALHQAIECIGIGGKLVVISFHSLEDRIVKKFISLQTKGDNFPRDLPVMSSQLSPKLRGMGKAIKASGFEVRHNPRARSAVMRVAEVIAH